jgi:hypothetical protein
MQTNLLQAIKKATPHIKGEHTHLRRRRRATYIPLAYSSTRVGSERGKEPKE